MYHRNSTQLLFIYLFVGTTFISCHHINDTYRLLADKLGHYNKDIRPTSNQSEPTVVNFSFTLISLNELDEVNQKVSVVALLSLTWTDDLMKWNPNEYGNMTTFQAESGRFWTPNLVLTNSAEVIDRTGADWRHARFAANGSAYYFPVEIFSVSCNVTVTFYPWDRHICILSFTPQGYPPTEMRIESTTSKANMAFYNENGAWEYIDSAIFNVNTIDFSSINVILIFERKPRFDIVNVILPIIFMSFLSVVVFLIPPDSGERISYTITMLLAIAVFLTLVGDNLPKTSNPMPFFSFYIIAMLATSICITLATIFNLRLFCARDNEPVPEIWKKLVTWCRKKEKPRRATAFDGVQNKNLNSVYIPDEDIQTKDIGKIKAQKSTTLKDTFKQRHQGQHKETARTVKSDDADSSHRGNESNIIWKDISAFLDILFFAFFFVIFLGTTVTYFVIAFSSDRVTVSDGLDIIESQQVRV